MLKVLGFGQLTGKGITFTRKHIRTLEAAGRFPRRIKLGDRAVAWYENEIDEWIASRPRVSFNDPAT